MPLGARELLLQMEARDNASAAIRGVGNAVGTLAGNSRFAGYQVFAMGLALQKAGTGLMNFGKAVLGAVGDTIQLGIEFDRNMRLVQTQARLGEAQLRRFNEAVVDVVATVPSSSAEVSEGLYDIFSSVEVNYKDAINMVTSFSRAATAGGTDVRTVTRGVIQIMNAFGLQANDTRSILDLLFKQVQQSTGTFEELVSAWGNVVSAAKSMDQKLFTTAGAVDFLTKRGRTQAQATISVSRALDQLSRHFEGVEKVLGVDVFDKATGNFRQLNDIIVDMGIAMQDLTTEEQVKAFEDMFGAGSIQANRFFRLAVPQFKELNRNVETLTKKDIQGFFKDAWDIMRDTPAVQIAILQNKWEALRLEVRDFFLPVLLDLVQIGKDVLDWFRDLSPETKELAARIIVIVGALAVFFGAIGRVGGGILLFASLLKFAGVGIVAFIKLFAGFGLLGGVIVAALVGAIVLVVTHWEEFTAFWERNWDTIKQILIVAIAAMTVVLANFARTALVNVGANLMNLVVSFQAAGGAAGAFGGVVKGVGSILRSIGWAALVFGILEVVFAFQDGRKEADKFFRALKKQGGDVISGARERINDLNESLRELSFWDRLAFWRFPEYARWKGEIQGLEDNLDGLADRQRRHQEELFAWADAIAEGDDAVRTFGLRLIWNTDLTKKQVEGFMAGVDILNTFRGEVDETTLRLVENLLVQGDLEAAQRLLNQAIKANRSGLKNLQSPQEHHNELIGDMGEKARRAAEFQRQLNHALNGGFGALKNILPWEEQYDEITGDLGQKLQRAAAMQRQLNGALNAGLGALKNLPSFAQQYAEKMGDLGQKLAAAAGAQAALNAAMNAMPNANTPSELGGGNTGGGNTGGGNNGGPGGATTSSVVNVNVSPQRANLDSRELSRELSWALNSGRLM